MITMVKIKLLKILEIRKFDRRSQKWPFTDPGFFKENIALDKHFLIIKIVSQEAIRK